MRRFWRALGWLHTALTRHFVGRHEPRPLKIQLAQWPWQELAHGRNAELFNSNKFHANRVAVGVQIHRDDGSGLFARNRLVNFGDLEPNVRGVARRVYFHGLRNDPWYDKAIEVTHKK
jgi:hypothetical protein